MSHRRRLLMSLALAGGCPDETEPTAHDAVCHETTCSKTLSFSTAELRTCFDDFPLDGAWDDDTPDEIAAQCPDPDDLDCVVEYTGLPMGQTNSCGCLEDDEYDYPGSPPPAYCCISDPLRSGEWLAAGGELLEEVELRCGGRLAVAEDVGTCTPSRTPDWDAACPAEEK